jgi:hypothetical protein
MVSAADFRKSQGLPPPGGGDAPPSTAKPQIRIPKRREPNKTEAEFGRTLKSTIPDARIMYEPFTLRLPSGTRYTPDFILVRPTVGGSFVMLAYEVKGPHIHNPASIRAFKEAKSAFPWIVFVFAQKRKGEWTFA